VTAPLSRRTEASEPTPLRPDDDEVIELFVRLLVADFRRRHPENVERTT
jgi:hypothetical protein